ncbi:MAG: hypothetical protein AAF629_29960 [Chloroflexota bacterium]
MSRTNLNHDVKVVIRAAGERTEALCYDLISKQVPEAHISIIHEIPFSAAVAKTFNLGISHNLPWTLAVDADIMVGPTAIKDLLDLGNNTEPHIFEIQGQILDKLFGGPRPGGGHLYRTQYLPQALEYVSAGGVTKRPESFVIRQMADQGHPWFQGNMVFGLHDYEQYYRDIYRKAFVHAHKHKRFMTYLASLWKKMATDDADYSVALRGFEDGAHFEGTVKIDINMFSQDAISGHLSQLHLSEKTTLAPTTISQQEIGQFLADFIPPTEYWIYRFLQNNSSVSRENILSDLHTLRKQIGWVQMAKFLSLGIQNYSKKLLNQKNRNTISVDNQT